MRSLFAASSALFLLCSALACGGDQKLVPLPAGSGAGADSGTGGSAAGGSNAGGAAGANDRRLVLLFTSDEHSHLFAFAPELDDFPTATTAGTGPLVGGIARRKTLIDQERAAAKAAGKGSVLASGGDNQMGTLSQIGFATDAIDYGVLSDLGYDATCLGNHEFDFGPANLAKSLTVAQGKNTLIPVVSSNIHFSATDPGDDTLAALYSTTVTDTAPVHPYHVVTTDNGIKVGFLGAIGVDASHVAPNKAPVGFSETAVAATDAADPVKVLPALYADLQPVVDTLRNDEKVDVVVLLSHCGQQDPDPTKGEDYQIGQNVSGIDVIVSGHAHNADPTPALALNAASGKTTVVLNASAYGRHLGEVEIAVGDAGNTVELTTQKLIPVDETIVPDAGEAAKIGPLVDSLESASFSGGGAPYLPSLLSIATGKTITDAAGPGDLYFYPLSKTTFDLTDTHAILFLTADAQLAAANAIEPTDFALQSGGVTRNVIKQGKTGVISASDAFSIVPLGESPTDGSVGYPLARANVILAVVVAIFEYTSAIGPGDSDYDLAPAGLLVEYDCTRPTAVTESDLFDPTKGRVTKITMDSTPTDGVESYDTVIFERGVTTQTDMLTKLYSVATSTYIASFANTVGATLEDDKGMTLTPAQAILHRADGTEIKEVESFFAFLSTQPGGTLPSTYDATSAQKTARFAAMTFCP